MQYAIELYFDSDTERALDSLARKVGEENISQGFLGWKSRPHLTLACFSDVDEALCIERLKAFASETSAIDVGVDSIGMFCDTKVVFASPTMTSSMYDIQRRLHERLSGFDTKGWEWYTPDNWVPHCTLAMTGSDPEDAFFRAGELIMREFEKLQGRFESVGLVKITHPVQELFTVKLGG